MTFAATSLTPQAYRSLQAPKKLSGRAFWIKTLGEFSEGGLSVQAFCRLKSLSPSNFYTWRKRLREEEREASLSVASFIPLEVLPEVNSPSLLKESPQNQQVSFYPDVRNGEKYSGLTLYVTKDLKISIDKDFHGATLKRVAQLFSSTESAKC